MLRALIDRMRFRTLSFDARHGASVFAASVATMLSLWTGARAHAQSLDAFASPVPMAESGPGDGELHGVFIAKVCESPRKVGELTSCEIVVGYNDDFGDTLMILEAFDVVDPNGSAVRVPNVGNLEIVAVSGNTTAVVGGSLPVNIGPSGSTLGGLPGAIEPGVVTFRQDTYVIQPGDPDPLPDRANVVVMDLCDAENTQGCSMIPNLVQFTAATDIINPGISVVKGANPGAVCEGVDTPVDFTITVNNTGDVPLENIVLNDSLCGSFGNPSVPDSGDVDGDNVLDLAEVFIDLNGSGAWEPGEPIIADNGNGVWDDTEVWTYTCAANLDTETMTTTTISANVVDLPECPADDSFDLTVVGNPTPNCFILGPAGACPGATGLVYNIAESSQPPIPGVTFDWVLTGDALFDNGTQMASGSSVTVNADNVCSGSFSLMATVTTPEGCTNTCTLGPVVVQDTTPPTFTDTPDDATVACDGNGNPAALAAFLAQGAATDNCSAAVITNDFSGLSDLCGATGAADVTFTATDACGNMTSVTRTFTIFDNTPPAFTQVPMDATVECDGNGNVAELNAFLAQAAAVDACGSVVLTDDFAGLSDLCGATGSATVTFTATDECGNQSTRTATFTIEDTIDPVFTFVPQDVDVECDGLGNPDDLTAFLNQGMATDNCGPVTIEPGPFGLAPMCGATGAAIVTFNATDPCGNSVSAVATFRIIDSTPPTFTTPPSDMTVECDGAGNQADIAAFLAQGAATDACGSVDVDNDFNGLSDLCGATGSALVTFTATDECGNTTTATATLTVVDTTPPAFTLFPADASVECDGSGNPGDLAAFLAQGAATDACGSVTISDDFASLSDLCGATGSATVTFTATDDCGNTATATATFTIVDTTPPVFSATPVDATVECDGNGNPAALAVFLAQGTATDACGPATIDNDFTSLSDLCGATGSALVTFTATDDCGNTATATATFTIVDTTPPTFTAVPQSATVECDGNGNPAALAAFLAQGSATDACGPVTISDDFASLSDLCGATGAATVTFTATDDCGNMATATATFTIVDTTPPAFTVNPLDVAVECDGAGNPGDLATFLAQGVAGDSCGAVQITNNFTSVSDLCGATGAALVTFTATDDCGNTATATATFSIIDTTPPTFTAVPQDATVECDGNGNPAALAAFLAQGAATDACGPATISDDFVSLSDLCGATGSATVTFTATDDCGNTATATATFTIVDTTPPAFTLFPADATVECDGSGNPGDLAAFLAQGAATDACGSVTISDDFASLSDLCGATGSATVTFTATDDCGNMATATATFTIVDTTPPAFTVFPTDATVECDGNGNPAALAAFLAQGAATDACGPATISDDFVSLSDLCGATGSATVTFTATDDCGNMATATATFTIVDTTPPAFTAVPQSATVECDGNGNPAALAAFLAQGAASDSCGPVMISDDFASLSDLCGATGAATVTFTATDDCGNMATATATFTIVDTTPPAFTVFPADATVECDGIGNPGDLAAFLAQGAANDSCGPVTISDDFTGVSDLCGATGSATVTFTATDDCGNMATATATFTIVDTTPPAFTAVPQDATVECDGNGNPAALAAFLAQGAATDACGPATISDDFVSLSDLCGATGSAMVTFTATDDCGNTATATATFTIVDTTPPAFTVFPADATVECDGSGNPGDLAAFLAQGAADDSCGPVTISDDFASLSDLCGATGSATVTFTATDDCGNMATATATFTIVDTTPPAFTVFPADATVECDGNGNPAALAAFLAQGAATDACGPAMISDDFVSLSDLCGATGSATVTFTATDDCGNTATATATFTIVDTTPPAFTVFPTDATVECDGNGNPGALAAFLAQGAANDSCGPVTISDDFVSLSDLCGATGSATVTFTATDDCGNMATATATFTIVDTTPPAFTQAPTNVTVECDGNGNLTALTKFLGQGTATDACGSATIDNDFVSLSDLCGATGAATVTFTATDDCGNTATTVATFTIVDTTPPTFTAVPQDATVECDGSGNPAALAAFLAQGAATDACGSATISDDFASLSDLCGATGSATVTFTATDECGNTATATATFTIVDTTPPAFTVFPADATVECDGSGNPGDLAAFLAQGVANDSCGPVTISDDFASLSDLCGATGAATVTFTATDDCGNMATATATFTIVDTTPPAFTVFPADATVECDGNGNPAALAAFLAQGAATDACGPATISDDFVSLSDLCGATGSATVTFTATDDCGNTATATATFTIVDTTPPAFTVFPADATVECDGNGNPAALAAFLAQGAATDACGPATISDDFVSLSDLCGATGAATVTFTATDDCGNATTATATFTIVDTTPPVFTVTPQNATVECDGNGNPAALAAFLAQGVATDECSLAVITNDFANLSDLCGATGAATVTFTATDDCGNTATAMATFTIVDTTPPAFTAVPQDATVECDGNGNPAALAAFLAQGAATDACGTAAIANDFVSLSNLCGATGAATVTFTATDECGNGASVMATFTIVDTTPPAFTTLPQNVTVECDGSGNLQDLMAFMMTPTAGDSCGTATVTNDFSNGPDLCGATTQVNVTFTATDECGNDTTALATFTIVDTTPPVLTVPPSTTVECDGNGNPADLAAFLAGASATDVCGTVAVVDDFTSLSDLCGATGSATVTFVATDECGNTATDTATFTIVDTTPPTIFTPPNDVTVECDGNGNPAALAAFLDQVVGVDTCGTTTVTNDFTGLSNVCGAAGSALVTFTVTDACGNTATATATFTIEDTTPPTFTIVPQDVVAECDGVGNPNELATFLAQGEATDICGNVTITPGSVAVSDLCGETGAAIVTFVATDACGNTAMTVATFQIVDTTPPTFSSVPTDVTVECDGNGNPAALAAFLAQGAATDTCGAATVGNDFTSLTVTCGQSGATPVTFTATDECGNASIVVATFTIQDTTNPSFTTLPADVTVECDGNGNPGDLAAFLAQGAGTDTCGTVNISNDYGMLSDGCGDTGSALVNFTLADECGNSVSVPATFTIVDTTPPAFSSTPMDVTVECDGNGNPADLAAFLAQGATTDACGTTTIDNNFVALTDECGETGRATVTFTATDECGNTSTATATFQIVDTTPPAITCGDIALECDGAGNLQEILDWLDSCTATDGCSEPVSVTNDFSGFPGSTGTLTVTFTATDGCGNTGMDTATLTITDNVPPIFVGSFNDVTVECDGNGNSADMIAFVAQCQAVDDCDDVTLDFQFVNAPGCGETGVTTITCIATDGAGNVATTTANFTIVDTTPPMIFCPSAVTVNCADGVPPADPNTVSALDVCSDFVTVTHLGDVSSGMCPETIVRTYRAEDPCGNFVTCQQTITNFCGPGACCLPDASCEERSEADCIASGGEWQGPCVPCDNACFERAHPGWNYYDNLFTLTGDQPTYWSLLSGQPAVGGLAPFTALDPGFPPGRPANDGTGDRYLRGWVLGWAVNAGNQEIAWNHLAGNTTVINYRDGMAWETSSVNFPVIDGFPRGQQTGTPGTLNLDGTEFAFAPSQLVFNFTAPGSPSASGPRQVVSNSQLSLHPISADLRQEGDGPLTTKANFSIWNQNEVKFSGTHRCITCWDQTLLSNYALSNHFLLQNLQTDRGKARIDGLQSQVCNVDVDFFDGPLGSNPNDVISQAAALLGVSTEFLSFDGGVEMAAHARQLIGLGFEPATVQYDILAPPPEFPAGPAQMVRATSSEKGSLVVFPSVELRWDRFGFLVQDTFLSLTNDYPEDVRMQFYFINGDPPLEEMGAFPAPASAPEQEPGTVIDALFEAVNSGAGTDEISELIDSFTESVGGTTPEVR